MKRLTYLNVHVYVDDNFAEAVLHFASALARNNMAETLRFNAVDKKARPKTVTFLLGPASSLVIESTDVEGSEPDNREALEFVQERLRGLAIARPQTTNRPDLEHGSGMH